MSTSITETKAGFSLAPQNIEELLKYAEILSKSDLVPKDFIGKPGNIIVAIQWGLEIGLQAMQAMQNIAVINGRPSLWGDSVIALVKASPLCEYVLEEVTETGATCKVKRRGELEQVRYFTMDDAAKAGLKGKQGPWTQYPKRMLQMRARSWALRDVFPDVLKGMPIAEELQDMPTERDITSQGSTIPSEPLAKQFVSDEAFAAQLPKWKSAVQGGKKTVADLIIWIESKGADLTEAQATEIKSWAIPAQEVQTIDNEATQEPVKDDFLTDYNASEEK